MAHYYGSDQIERLKHSIDIVSVIESYVPLKRQGSGFAACCPFHEEKTPSFMVYPDSQTFHCFGGGCGKGGDVIHFVQEIDRLSFNEAVETLADRAGIGLTPEKSRQTRSSSSSEGTDKNSLFKANQHALDFYMDSLNAAEGKQAVEYLKEREISNEMIQRFSLGFGGGSIVSLIKKNKFPFGPFEETGLINKNDRSGTWFEPFRNRLIFPIKDVRGRVVGFGGRILEASGERKYVNSPSSPVFDKKSTVYGIDKLKEIKEDSFPIVIVEGYTDVIGLYQHGFIGAVATLGTALSSSHIRILKRFTDMFVLLFDSDAPGLKAAEKSIDLFVENEIQVTLITLDKDMDPFDFVTTHDIDAFKAKLSSADSMYDFKKRVLIERNGSDTPHAVNKVIKGLATAFGKSPSSLMRELLFKDISDDFGISLSSIEELHSNARKTRSAAPPEKRVVIQNLTALDKAEENILRTVLRFPEIFPKTYEKLNTDIFQHDAFRTVYKKCAQQFDKDNVLIPNAVLSYIDNAELAGIVSGIINENRPVTLEKALELNSDSIVYIQKKNYERKIKTLKDQLTQAKQNGDKKGAIQHLYEINILQKTAAALQNR